MYAQNSNSDALIEAIAQFPKEWNLTPCVGKQNFWPGWQREALDRTILLAAIQNQVNQKGEPCQWTGVSIVTGPLSNGVMAIDFDGLSALRKYFDTSNGEPPPVTKRWTSGRSGHFQILLRVPPEKWEGLKPQKIELDNGEKLELRWQQCSTLPPSIHPETKKPYRWENDGEIAEAPEFILNLMREKPPAVEWENSPRMQNTIYSGVEQNLVDILNNEIIPRLDAEKFYSNPIPGYSITLKRSGETLKGLCPLHPEKSPSFTVYPEKNFYCFGCHASGRPIELLHQLRGYTGSPTGQDFTALVKELADRVGVQLPERQQSGNTRSHGLESNTQNPKPNNLLKHPANYTPESAPAEEILSSVDNLLAEGLTPAQQIVSSLTAAKQAGVPEKVLRELLAERQAEQELDWSILDSVSKFKKLHHIQNSPIDLREFFPPALATALLSKAESDRIDPVRIMQSFLPVVGTMLGGRVGIEIKPGEEEDDAWVEYPIINTVDVGYASTGKTATQNSLLKPIKKMQAAEQERMDEALNELVQLEEAWKEISKEERAEKIESDQNPRVFSEKHCKPKKWIINPQRASAQAITKRIAEQQPKHGCLLVQDELSGLFASLDQFTGGNSGQRQFILEAWNGRLEGSVDRVDLKSDSYTFHEQTISITGTIQPDIARHIFNMTSDPDGMLSRFLPAVAGIPDNFAQRPTVRVSLNRMMTEVIKGLEAIPDILLIMPARTADVYWAYWEKLRNTQEISFGENPAYSQFVGKQISYVGRFAIILHCLENLGASEIPSQVTPEIMNKAIRLSLFYCNQFLLLQSKSAQQQPIEGILLDILKFVQQQGGKITTRQLCQSRFKRLQVEGKKFSAYFAQKFLQAIADAGYGTFEEKTLNLLPLLPFVAGGVTALKATPDKGLSGVCRQNSKVYISGNSEADPLPREADFPEALIDEFGNKCLQISECYKSLISLVPDEDLRDSEKMAADESAQWEEEEKNIGFGKTATPDLQTHTALEKQAATKRQQTATNGNKRQHLENSEQLNEDEVELLEMLKKTVADKDPDFASQVRGILKDVCDSGAADHKKVWEALTEGEQKTFTKLLAVEIQPKVEEVDRELLSIEQQLLDIKDLDTFLDFADWLDDSEYLEAVCLSLGGESEKLWLAHQIQNYFNLEDKAAAVEAIAKLRQRFAQEILQVAGKLAVGDRGSKALAQLGELVLASKVELVDAEKMRGIALVWWNESPQQSLMTQMFGRNAPGTKYSPKVLGAWLKCQSSEVRDRLVKLSRDAGRGEGGLSIDSQE